MSEVEYQNEYILKKNVSDFYPHISDFLLKQFTINLSARFNY